MLIQHLRNPFAQSTQNLGQNFPYIFVITYVADKIIERSLKNGLTFSDPYF